MSASLIIQSYFFPNSRSSTVRRKLLSSYSDQQILTGVGIQAVGLAQMDTLVPYHFFLIWMLSLCSMAVHNATLLALVADFRRDWVLRWLRQVLMLVNLVLSAVYGIFILQVVRKDLEDSTLPIACAWAADAAGKSGTSASNVGVSYAGTIAVIAGNAIVFAASTWYLHSRNRRFFGVAKLVGIMAMSAVAIGATVRIVLLSQAFGKPNVELSDDGEQAWSFGSLISLLFLLLPLMSLLEIARGEMRIVHLVRDKDDDEKPLVQHGLGNPLRDSFQPIPFVSKKGRDAFG